jgi:polyisoprenoid-binding protein YceI
VVRGLIDIRRERMRNWKLQGLMIVAAASTAIAWHGISDGLSLTPESRLWIEGTSTVRDYKCTSTALQATVEAAGTDAVRALLGGNKAVKTVQFVVPAKTLDCGNSTMNGHMLTALKAGDHPDIAFRLVSYDLATGENGEKGTLNGVLTIGGTDQTIALPVQLLEGAAGALRVTGKYELNMKDYGLKPPSLMLGTMKVREKVTVNFDLLLKS